MVLADQGATGGEDRVPEPLVGARARLAMAGADHAHGGSLAVDDGGVSSPIDPDGETGHDDRAALDDARRDAGSERTTSGRWAARPDDRDLPDPGQRTPVAQPVDHRRRWVE